MTDEECIAIAMLHGQETFYNPREGSWFIDDVTDHTRLHPVEWQESVRDSNFLADYGWPSRGAAARAYCEYYNLLESTDAEV